MRGMGGFPIAPLTPFGQSILVDLSASWDFGGNVMLKRLKNSRVSIGIFFVCVFALYMTLMLEPYFTDEQDVF